MNFSSFNQRLAALPRAALAGLSLLLIWFTASAQNTPTTRTNPPSPDRYLLIVETSTGMKPRGANLQRTLGQLFSSGLNGQLHPGDTIGVWTYADELRTGKFPLKHWTPQTSRDISVALIQFLQQQNYDKPASLAPVLAQWTNVIANSERITVLLVSAGSETPMGTPFDASIAEAYKQNTAEQQEQSMPFITVIRAVRGEFTGFRVNTPPWPVEFPPFPAKPPRTAMTRTNESAPPPPPVTPAVIPEPAPAPVVTANEFSPPTNSPATSQIAVAPSVQPANQTVTTTPTPPPVASNVVPIPKEKTNTAPAALPATVPPSAPVEGKLPIIPILVGVAVAIVGLAILCFALLKRSREAPRVSLITRSMNKEGK